MAWGKAGTTTLDSSGDTISVTPSTSSQHYNILTHTFLTGVSINSKLRFNSDSGSNYASRYVESGQSDSTATNGSEIVQNTDVAQDQFVVTHVFSVSTEEKLVIAHTVDRGAAGAGTAPGRFEAVGKWVDTSNEITSIQIVNTSSGDFISTTNTSVLGTN
jgi:hypothetical protein